MRAMFIALVMLITGCDSDVSQPVICDECVNEKTCPDDVCNESAYEACLRAKVIAGICSEE